MSHSVFKPVNSLDDPVGMLGSIPVARPFGRKPGSALTDAARPVGSWASPAAMVERAMAVLAAEKRNAGKQP
jgi:hypothetical protein